LEFQQRMEIGKRPDRKIKFTYFSRQVPFLIPNANALGAPLRGPMRFWKKIRYILWFCLCWSVWVCG